MFHECVVSRSLPAVNQILLMVRLSRKPLPVILQVKLLGCWSKARVPMIDKWGKDVGAGSCVCSLTVLTSVVCVVIDRKVLSHEGRAIRQELKKNAKSLHIVHVVAVLVSFYPAQAEGGS